MKSLFKIFTVILLTVGFLNAEPINQDGQKDGYDVKLSSQKSLIVGTNELTIEISKDGVLLTDPKVKLKIFIFEIKINDAKFYNLNVAVNQRFRFFPKILKRRKRIDSRRRRQNCFADFPNR